jgi:hypothetical protein
MREIFFVLPEKYREKKWPDLLSIDKNFSLEDLAPRMISGIDCWIVQTGLLLKKYSNYNVEFVNKGVSGKICVYHYNNALIKYGVHESFSVVIRADRPPVNFADITVEQNPAIKNSSFVQYIPHWPQPGIIPRDTSRKSRVEKIAYIGSSQYVPKYVKDKEFSDFLSEKGITFSYMVNGDWLDHREVDVLIAVRDVPESVLMTKPASKLVNSWLAGVPIILGSEPAYRAIRQSDFDYLEANNLEELLRCINVLISDNALYIRILKNAEIRRQEYSLERVVRSWIDFFESIDSNIGEYSRGQVFLRKIKYYKSLVKNRVWRLACGWRD